MEPLVRNDYKLEHGGDTMFNFDTHAYSVVLTDCNHKYDGTFLSRSVANQKVYQLCEKLGLTIVSKYEDHHDITFICDNGAKFHVNRVY